MGYDGGIPRDLTDNDARRRSEHLGDSWNYLNVNEKRQTWNSLINWPSQPSLSPVAVATNPQRLVFNDRSPGVPLCISLEGNGAGWTQ